METKQAQPYPRHRKDIFWRTAVADIQVGRDLFRDLVTGLPVSQDSKIVSAGSCFAQHIGKWLEGNGFQFLRSRVNSHQVSSFAFGNIYTVRSLVQWFTHPDDHLAEHSIHFDEKRDRYFDMLLLTGHEEGWQSRQGLLEYRQAVVDEARNQIAASDCFIFTLGLTESWEDTNGVCYPVCPGTRIGKFDGKIFRFRQLRYQDVLDDLVALNHLLKALNPAIQLILTVSPVPLTATATERHVMVATAYSKGVLRAVAGDFCDRNDHAFYFPSFELITTTLPADFRFLENRRTVSMDGVNYVMRHWESIVGEGDPQDSDGFEVDCDEEKLAALQSLTSGTPESADEPRHLTLIGDSHMGKLAKALGRMQEPFCGGMIMNGSGFALHKFSLCPEEIMVPLENAGSRKLWSQVLENLGRIQESGGLETSTVLCNVGQQTHQTANIFISWMRRNRPQKLQNIELQDFVDFFNDKLQDQMSIVFHLKERGHRVIVISDTPFWQYVDEGKSMAPVVMAYMDAMQCVWEQLGIEYFHAARIFGETVTNPMAYTSDLVYKDGRRDWFHGNDAYYDWLAERLLERVGNTLTTGSSHEYCHR